MKGQIVYVQCSQCRGTGMAPSLSFGGSASSVCPACGGSGSYAVVEWFPCRAVDYDSAGRVVPRRG